MFNTGATVNLGAGNTLTNAGTLSPGGAGVIQTTALTGNLVQTATGDFAHRHQHRRRHLRPDQCLGHRQSGRRRAAAGAEPDIGAVAADHLSAAGGTTNNGLTLLASPALQAQLVFPNATDVVVRSTGINFLAPGLNNNQTALANAFNGAVQTAGLG